MRQQGGAPNNKEFEDECEAALMEDGRVGLGMVDRDHDGAM